jgi:hypothetical protein
MASLYFTDLEQLSIVDSYVANQKTHDHISMTYVRNICHTYMIMCFPLTMQRKSVNRYHFKKNAIFYNFLNKEKYHINLNRHGVVC